MTARHGGTAYYSDSHVTILLGDCREILPTLDAGSVHCCVTSPPYFGLRDYGGDAQIGLEQTPAAYVAELTCVFEQVRRVLRQDGTAWVNLGDSYVGGGGFAPGAPSNATSRAGQRGAAVYGVGLGVKPHGTLKPKDLIGIPFRVAFALQDAGWWLRSDIIWSKGNPMPESVTDRPTKAHEYLFLLAKAERYFYDMHGIAEPVASNAFDADAIRDVQYRHGNQTMFDMFADTATDGVLPQEEWTEPGREMQGVRDRSYSGVAQDGSRASCCSTCGGEIQPVGSRQSDAGEIRPHGEREGKRQDIRSVREGESSSQEVSTDGQTQGSVTAVLRERQGTADDQPLLCNTERQRESVEGYPQTASTDPDPKHANSSGVGRDQAVPRLCMCVLRTNGSTSNTRSHHPDLEGRRAHQGEHRSSVPKLQQSQGQSVRNRRSVWQINTQPFRGAHFAVMPERLVELCILAGCPAQTCSACGAPWVRVVKRIPGAEQPRPKADALAATGMSTNGTNGSTLSISGGSKGWNEIGSKSIDLGFQPSCHCNATTLPGVVLDCFGGSGTTARVAKRLGRRCVIIEQREEYAEMAAASLTQQVLPLEVYA